MIAKDLGVAYSRELELLRGMNRSGANNEFTPRLNLVFGATLIVCHPTYAVAFEKHAPDGRLRLDAKVRSLARRLEKGDGGAGTPAANAGELEESGAFLLRAVEVVIAPDTCLRAPIDEGFRQNMAMVYVRYAEPAVSPMIVAGAAHIAFRSFEIRQDVTPSPAAIAELLPQVIIL